MAAARMANLKNGSNRFQKVGVSAGTPTHQESPVTRERAAKLFAVGPASVGRARRVLREAGQKTVDAIDQGDADIFRLAYQILPCCVYSGIDIGVENKEAWPR